TSRACSPSWTRSSARRSPIRTRRGGRSASTTWPGGARRSTLPDPPCPWSVQNASREVLTMTDRCGPSFECRLVVFLLLGAIALAPAPAAESSPPTATPERFHLQSRFWVCLHQTLLAAAQAGDVANPGGDDREKQAWDRAVGSYRDHFGKRSPVF